MDSATCIFCSIIAKNENIVFQDEDIFVLNDIKPAAKYHLLVIPRRHIVDAKCLTKEDTPLLKTMIERAKILLQERDVDESDSRLVFHWPPFHSISHLHLHVIAPVGDMSFFGRIIFKPNTWWAVTLKKRRLGIRISLKEKIIVDSIHPINANRLVGAAKGFEK